MSQKNVYFPVESFVGLGHFNRTGKIVQEMVKQGFNVTVASGSFIDPERFFAGARQVTVPHYLPQISLGPKVRSVFNQQQRIAERRDTHLESFAETKADVLMSEFWPFDRPRLDPEMEALIEASKAKPNSVRIASIRDILDVPVEDMTPARQAEIDQRRAWAVKAINENFDAVLVHGDPNFIPLSETFPLLDQIKIPVIYTGYVLDAMPKRDMSIPAGDRPVLVSCGAGAEACEMILSCMTSWEKLLQWADLDDENDPAYRMTNHPLHVVCGPRFPEREFEEITAWGKQIEEKYGVSVTVEKYRQDYTQVLANAAFSISFAGYNTTLETLALEVPCLFVPYYRLIQGHMRVNSEQLYRLEKLQEKNYAPFAHPKEVQDSNLFADRLLKEYVEQTAGAQQQVKLNFDGAKNTVSMITRLITEKEAAAAMQPATAIRKMAFPLTL